MVKGKGELLTYWLLRPQQHPPVSDSARPSRPTTPVLPGAVQAVSADRLRKSRSSWSGLDADLLGGALRPTPMKAVPSRSLINRRRSLSVGPARLTQALNMLPLSIVECSVIEEDSEA